MRTPGNVTFIFTRRRRNLISWLIRWTMPRSRFALAISSHCIVDPGQTLFEATMQHGVREIDHAAGLAGQVVMRRVTYEVPDLAAGITWAESQLCPHRPRRLKFLPRGLRDLVAALDQLVHNNYDFQGALGLGLAPGRDWASEENWFCYEFAAGFLKACGRPVFENLSHVGETALFAINPRLAGEP